MAALYFTKEVMIPVALAILLSFLLAPLVRRLEKLHLSRALAVILVMGFAIMIIVGIGWLITYQLRDLAVQIGNYRADIQHKVDAVRARFGHGPVAKVSQEWDQITTAPTTSPSASPKPGIIAQTPAEPVLVTVTNPGEPTSPMQFVGTVVTFLGPVGEALLVIVFAIFMLIQREDLRDRIIRLIGHGQLTMTTQALDEAATRVSQYLFAQLIVNASVGIVIGIGLWLLHIPNAPLWGLLCAILRFIPYIGIWIAAAFPIILSIVLPSADGSAIARPIMTISLFAGLELIVGNLIEPYFYGNRTGVSSIAILVAAVFWTWLWGGVGLLLSTPLTVILAVMGKYVPHMEFLNILLGDQPVLEPNERYYQRLVADDPEEADDLIEDFLKSRSTEEVYDQILIPALQMAEADFGRGKLDDERHKYIRRAMKETVEALRERDESARKKEIADAATASTTAAAISAVASAPAAPGQKSIDPTRRQAIPKDCVVNVLCLPANDESDELVALMLVHLLAQQGYRAFSMSASALASEMVEAVSRLKIDLAIVSALPPGAIAHSRYLCKRLHTKFPDLNMLLGLWATHFDPAKVRTRIACDKAVGICSTLHDMMDAAHQQAQSVMLNPTDVQIAPVLV